MKINISKADSIVLDWLVAQCRGLELDLSPDGYYTYKPSSKWEHGGPIIERERISVISDYHEIEDGWLADGGKKQVFGPTPLIAAMRCYVASKLGEEVEVPDWLIELCGRMEKNP